MVGMEGMWKEAVFVTFYLLTQHLLKVLSKTTKISCYLTTLYLLNLCHVGGRLITCEYGALVK